MPESAKRRATYQDVLDAPEHMIAEIVDGDLRLTPRPGGPHTASASTLGHLIGPPFQFGNGGPGGWWIFDEPELHLDADILVPDLAGWRHERMASVSEDAAFTIAPDWVCEVLSLSTAVSDRAEKLPIYARSGVNHAWLVDARYRTVEVFRRQGRQWLLVETFQGNGRGRAEPFDAIELDFSQLWASSQLPPPGSRASEYALAYATK